MDLLGANLVLTCQRTGCAAQEIIEVFGVDDNPRSAYALSSILQEEWPEGWGWDQVGADSVLHCAEHRA